MAQQETILRGLGVSAGIAIGPITVQANDVPTVAETTISDGKVKGESSRLEEALVRTRTTLKDLKSKTASMPALSAQSISREINLLLDAHLHMLEPTSRLVRTMHQHIAQDKMNALWAVDLAIKNTANQFQTMDDPYLAARAGDVRELGSRLLRSFNGEAAISNKYPSGHIILADEFTPADTVLLDPAHVLAIATASGGRESHTAIMARAMNIPAVLGAPDLATQLYHSGTHAILDGSEGIIILNPRPDTLKIYQQKKSSAQQQQHQFSQLRDKQAKTLDEQKITLLANIELPRECAHVLDNGAEGVGLLRSEFIYMNRDDLPDENEQYQFYRAIIEQMDKRPVTIRTLDVGGEKLATSMGDMLNEKGENPALGLRAIRFALKFPDIFRVQLKAILRACQHGQGRILLPMISCAQEIIEARAILTDVALELKRQGEKITEPLPPIGIMIETPAAAIAADNIAHLCDFFSIGTNDLTMYALAIDRGNEEVAHLYTPLNPAVLHLIHLASLAAHKHSIPLVVCGEIAGDPFYTALLIGLGAHELSMSPGAVPKVKNRIFSIDAKQAQALAQKALKARDDEQINGMMEAFHANETS